MFVNGNGAADSLEHIKYEVVPAISSLFPFQTSVARLISIWVDVDADLEESRFVEIVMVDYT